MDLQHHWERVYNTKRTDEVSWFQPHLETSLELIRRTGAAHDARIVDVGAGASTLVDDLLDAGYSNVTLLDVSSSALQRVAERLGPRASAVTRVVGDVTRIEWEPRSFDVWHDRAVFHFLTEPDDRRRYVRQVRNALAPGGYVIVATFGPDGPQRCSGLSTARYAPEALHAEFGTGFELIERREERHHTPAGVDQQFIYCL
jgi:SAM-dependent methyltransferase